jgi:hypothetical protein
VTKYHDVQCLQIGKAPQEGEHHLGHVVVAEAHIQTEDLDARDNGAWARLYPRLECTQLKKGRIFSHKHTSAGHFLTS